MHCALFEAIVRAQVNRKGVYMTSFIKTWLYVILRSCFHQNQRFALTTIVNAHFWAAFMLILRRQNQRFETLIQNALHGSTVHASLEKKTISWACTAHCSRLLFELKFIWRHLNVVICDFAFMLPPESAFCSNHDRKRTFLGCVHAYFAKAESAFWNADSKRRSKTPSREYCSCFPREEDDFVSMHCALFEAIVRAQVNRKGVYMTSFKRGYMWFCVHASTRISVLL